jgi:hypothetical protein
MVLLNAPSMSCVKTVGRRGFFFEWLRYFQRPLAILSRVLRRASMAEFWACPPIWLLATAPH